MEYSFSGWTKIYENGLGPKDAVYWRAFFPRAYSPVVVCVGGGEKTGLPVILPSRFPAAHPFGTRSDSLSPPRCKRGKVCRAGPQPWRGRGFAPPAEGDPIPTGSPRTRRLGGGVTTAPTSLLVWVSPEYSALRNRIPSVGRFLSDPRPTVSRTSTAEKTGAQSKRRIRARRPISFPFLRGGAHHGDAKQCIYWYRKIVYHST